MSEKKQPIDSQVHLEVEPEINRYFKAAIKAQASDLHLKVGHSLKLRVNKDIKDTTAEVMTEERIEKLVFEILNDKQKQFLLENGSLDFAYEISQSDRFRVNVFRQRSKISLSARRIVSAIPPFESLHLPPAIETIADKSHEGLILVGGPGGCGKSTTIASMINHINNTRPCHIITIEDPLEFIYVDKKAIVSQREIGLDVRDYEDALKSLKRQDPDVVLIGELQEKETVTAAIRAAETGKLVFGTLNAANGIQAIQRLVDLFPQEERSLVRQTLANVLRAVISQMLLSGSKKTTPRVPAVEILIATPVVRNLIADGHENEVSGIIKTGESDGMLDFIESLRGLVEGDWIDLKTALQYAPNVEELKMALKGIRSRG
ncbi:MAG: PilT/PilU family type 4a pilus ATPase [Planctomycetes bacterium]|nr:PilT/PilU family type 4a pilus ATPase [Planctomycetota bacterium]MBU1518565.1 PilT/PilU family type 4a pilus ATPase [Planctomycetota bacterium]